jgi:putative transposase
MQRDLTFSEGEYYHIYNRGVEKRIIFPEKADQLRFLVLLYFLNTNTPINIRESLKTLGPSSVISDLFREDREESLVDIGAYCLMPNHFHLLIKEKSENGISVFMKKILTAYSMYFNKKHERKGPLFESRFMAQHANSDEYLKYLYSYIHLNPIKLIQSDWKEKGIRNISKAKTYLNNYEYSSYLDYLGVDRASGVIINRQAFPEYFSEGGDFEGDILDWLSLQP